MPYIGDSRKERGPGFLALQDHGWKKQGIPLQMRTGLLAVRVKGRLIDAGELGHHVIERGTTGDITGGQLWKQEPGDRPGPMWRFGPFAARTFGGRFTTTVGGSVGSGGATTPSGGQNVQDHVEARSDDKTVWDPVKGMFVQQTYGETDYAPSGGFRPNPAQTITSGTMELPALPVGDAKWRHDDRFKAERTTTPRSDDGVRLWPYFPADWFGITTTTTREDAQETLFLPTDPRLVAVNAGSDPAYGSLVCDMAGSHVDPRRIAPLHSLTRVVKMVGGGRLSLAGPRANALAWNIGASGNRDSLGGLITDDAAGHARVSVRDGGPFSVGLPSCPHTLGTDADGNTVRMAHLSTTTLFEAESGTGKDGPIEFSKRAYPYPPAYPYQARTFIAYDRNFAYKTPRDSQELSFKGAWRLFSEFPMGVVTPPGGPPTTTPPGPPTTRTPSDPPPPPPPTGPTTPGGGEGGGPSPGGGETGDPNSPGGGQGGDPPWTGGGTGDTTPPTVPGGGPSTGPTTPGGELDGQPPWTGGGNGGPMPPMDPGGPVPPPAGPYPPGWFPWGPIDIPLPNKEPANPNDPWQPWGPGGGTWYGPLPPNEEAPRAPLGVPDPSNPYGPKPTIVPGEASGGRIQRPTIVSHMEFSPNSTVHRAFKMEEGETDWASWQNPPHALVAALNASAPAVLREVAFAAQGGNTGGSAAEGGDPFTYTQDPTASRSCGGTASGMVLALPPEVDLTDVGTDFVPPGVTVSEAGRLNGPGVSTAWGTPDLVTGGVDEGVRIIRSGTSAVVVQTKASGAAWETVGTIDPGVRIGRLPCRVITSNSAVVAGEAVVLNVSGGNVSATLPASPADGDTVRLKRFGANTAVAVRNGNKIDDAAADFTFAADGDAHDFVFDSATASWWTF